MASDPGREREAKVSKPIRAGSGRTRNLSEDGACVELAERLPIRTPLDLSLLTDLGTITAEARVVWAARGGRANSGISHGLAFTRITGDDLVALVDLLLVERQARERGGRIPVELPVLWQRRQRAGRTPSGKGTATDPGGTSTSAAR